MTPRVSVVVPNYNHARYLEQRLASVLGQRYQDLELILLDDASSDGSRAILERHATDPRVRTAWNERNSGSPFKQWNKGARMARGEYLWIAESDDYADPRFLERLVPLLDANPRVGLAYCQSLCVDEDGRVLRSNAEYTAGFGPRWTESYVNDGRDEIRRYLIFMNTIPNASAVLLRRSVLAQVGYAIETMRLSGDHDLWVKMLLRSDVAFEAEALSCFRQQTRSVRSNTYTNGVYLDEAYDVRALVLSQLDVPKATVEWVHDDLVDRWVQLVLLRQGQIPWRRNLSILRKAWRLDPDLPRRLARRAALQGLRPSTALATLRRMLTARNHESQPGR